MSPWSWLGDTVMCNLWIVCVWCCSHDVLQPHQPPVQHHLWVLHRRHVRSHDRMQHVSIYYSHTLADPLLSLRSRHSTLDTALRLETLRGRDLWVRSRPPGENGKNALMINTTFLLTYYNLIYFFLRCFCMIFPIISQNVLNVNIVQYNKMLIYNF